MCYHDRPNYNCLTLLIFRCFNTFRPKIKKTNLVYFLSLHLMFCDKPLMVAFMEEAVRGID